MHSLPRQSMASGAKVFSVGALGFTGIFFTLAAFFTLVIAYFPMPWAVQMTRYVLGPSVNWLQLIDSARGFFGPTYFPYEVLSFVVAGGTTLGISVFLSRKFHVRRREMAMLFVTLAVIALYLVPSFVAPIYASASSTQTAIGGQWQEEKPCSFYVFTDGTNYYAQNCDTGAIAYGGPGNAGGATGTNATQVFQNTLNAFPASTHGSVAVAPGTYTIHPAIKLISSLTVWGSGDQSRLRVATAGQAIFYTNGQSHITVTRMGFDSSGGTLGIGIKVSASTDIHIVNNYFQNLDQEVSFTNDIGNSFEIWFEDNYGTGNNNGFDMASGPTLEGVYISNNQFDSTGNGDQITFGGGASYVMINGNEGTGSASSGYGIVFRAGGSKISIYGNTLDSVGKECVWLSSGNWGGSIVGNAFSDCGQQAANTWDCIGINGDVGVTVTGNECSRTAGGTAVTMKYGVEIKNGGHDFVISNNVFRKIDFGTGVIGISSTSANVTIADNDGYNPLGSLTNPFKIGRPATTWNYVPDSGGNSSTPMNSTTTTIRESPKFIAYTVTSAMTAGQTTVIKIDGTQIISLASLAVGTTYTFTLNPGQTFFITFHTGKGTFVVSGE